MRLLATNSALGMLLACATFISQLKAQDTTAHDSLAFTRAIDLELLAPTTRNRRIHTVSADVGVSRVVARTLGATLGLSITPSYASGHIIQLNAALQPVRLETSAVGIGPTVHAQLRPIRWGRVHAGIDASAGLIFYSERFPAGGDIYNGMLRVGPVLVVNTSSRDRLSVSSRWMHVSNGQGLGAHNPSYEAYSLTVGFARDLSRPVESMARLRRRSRVGGAFGAAIGVAAGLVLSRHCEQSRCRSGPGITSVAALTGAAMGATLPAMFRSDER